MGKLKKLLPLWITLGTVLALTAALWFIEWLYPRLATNHGYPTAIALEDGVWEFHPTRGATLLRSWGDEPHFAVYKPTGIFAKQGYDSYIFEGNKVWTYQVDEQAFTLLAEGLPIDHDLGPAGVSIYYGGSRIDSVFFSSLAFVHAGTGRMERFGGFEQPMEVWTLSVWSPSKEMETYEQPITPREGWYREFKNGRYHLYCHVQREDGLWAALVTDLKDVQTGRHGSWKSEEPSGIVDDHWSQPEGRAQRYDCLPVGPYSSSFLLRDVFGSIYYYWNNAKTCIDRFSGVSKAEFLAAEVHDSYAVVRTDEGRRVYVHQRGYKDWLAYELEG